MTLFYEQVVNHLNRRFDSLTMKASKLTSMILLFLPLLPGCSAGEKERSEQETIGQIQEDFELRSPDPEDGPVAYAYECEDGSSLVARPGPEDQPLAVFYQEKTYALQPVEGAPGMRYESAEMSFVSHGDEVIISMDSETLECQEQTRQTLIETARLRGANFWAAGADPEWTMRIGELSTRLEIPSQDLSYEFPTPPPEAGSDTNVSILSGETDGKRIRIEYEGTMCQLQEPDQSFPFAVQIEINGAELQGCGQALID